MPQPPEKENKLLTWPDWPLKLRTSSSHEEGAERDFAVLTHEVLRRERPGHRRCIAPASTTRFKPIPGTEFELKADLVLLAMGFVHPVHEGLVKSLGRRARPARQRARPTPIAYRTSVDEGVRGRRHAPRPVAGGVGDPRRPPVRALHRQVPDGVDDAAALILSFH